MTSSGRPICPCCARRAERMLAAARRRSSAVLSAAALAALAVVCWPADRIVSICVTAMTAAAFIGWPFADRAHRQRRQAVADWRTWPPGRGPWAGR
jgi:hypothetical protein